MTLVLQSVEEVLVKILRGTIPLAKPTDVTRTQAMADLLEICPSVQMSYRSRESKRSSCIVVNRINTFALPCINSNADAAESMVDFEVYTSGSEDLTHKQRASQIRNLLRIILEHLSGLYEITRIHGIEILDEGIDLPFQPLDASDNWTFLTVLSVRVFHSIKVADICFPAGAN